MLQDIVWYSLPVLAIGIGLIFVRIVRGPSLPDRVVAADLLTTTAISFIALFSVVYDAEVFLDISLVLALISFVGTIGFAYYIDQRG